MTHPPQKILVGVDFSAESDRAVDHAAALARVTGAELVLVHACTVPDAPPMLDYTPPAMAEYRARLDADRASDRERLDALATRLTGLGLRASHRFADGFPDTALTEVARAIGADLTVVGTHGRTGLKWLLLGSVAQRVVRLAERDVLVARGEPLEGGYRRICVATDFSPSAERALDLAASLSHLGAALDLVHFWHMPPQLGLYEPINFTMTDEWRGSVEDELRTRGARLLAGHRRPGSSMTFSSIYEPVLPGLLEHLERGGYDLAVLGSHGRRGFRRFVLGSVAEEVARRAVCSVLVVHGGEAEAVEAAA
jgi:nucleotide-binding universal stress UspA family protein